MTVRKALVTVHLIVGCIAAPFLIVLGLSGALLVFEDPINQALHEGLADVRPSGPMVPLAAIESSVAAAHPGWQILAVEFPPDPDLSYGVTAASTDGSQSLELLIDPYTGRILGTAPDQPGPMRWVHRLHTQLVAVPEGSTILAISALLLAFLAVSGLYLWWPGKIFTVGWRGSGRRLVFDLHNAVGGVAWLFLGLFAVTAAVIHWQQPAVGFINRLVGEQSFPPQPDSAPACAGKAVLPLDQLMAAARAAAPGTQPASLQQRGGPQDPVRVALKYPEDRTPGGRTIVFLEPCSANLLQLRDSRRAPLSYRLTALWTRPLHTGDLLGWPSRIVACLFSLSLPLLAVTGPLIWWNRRRQRRERPVPEAA
jgi:uncharacterized iron-regulated membrane protein